MSTKVNDSLLKEFAKEVDEKDVVSSFGGTDRPDSTPVTATVAISLLLCPTTACTSRCGK